MDKRKQANQRVKDQLLGALIEYAGRKDWSKVTVTELVEQAGVARASFYRNFASVEELVDYGIRQVTQRYHEGMPDGDVNSRERLEFKFRFYQEHADLVLAFHRAKASTSLLDLITDCEIDAWGDMPMSSLARYELYFYAGAFYNVLLCWLESGMKEPPETMAAEFARMMGGP
ncbi:TetR/AcrR family transcriptional regulator [Gordonibacter sp. 28C]|uniref:TetR/AcrR family transcriptional regulator n=1 Tax=Gordonibacter sp. 28C TaxID=2078569 RepID=UPI000DF7E624|nr:TetR/AcrR family transcriptional regulator [Gordonibacter sp. 28C]RDB61929.1 TetR/AcrR family transcriptional regulator [Gordonibacter sp. 28C]